MRTACSSSRRGGGSASVHAGIHPLGVGLESPLGCGPADPSPCMGLETPQARPLKFPFWCGPADPPRVWACRPPPCMGLETPQARPLKFLLGCGPGAPWPDPSTSPLGVGLETCKACWDTTPPAARHAGIPPPPTPHPPPPPPWTEFLTHATENITLPQTSFAGGNKNAFEWDVYCPLVDHIPACTVAGVVYLPGRGVPAWGCNGPGVYLPKGVYVYLSGGTCPGTPPRGQTDTCENITFPNFVCRR